VLQTRFVTLLVTIFGRWWCIMASMTTDTTAQLADLSPDARCLRYAMADGKCLFNNPGRSTQTCQVFASQRTGHLS